MGYLKRFQLTIRNLEGEAVKDEVKAGCKWEAISKFFSRNGLALEKFSVDDLENYVSEV